MPAWKRDGGYVDDRTGTGHRRRRKYTVQQLAAIIDKHYHRDEYRTILVDFLMLLRHLEQKGEEPRD